MLFPHENTNDQIYFSRYECEHLLSSHGLRSFELDGHTWPSIEHYFQAMKFDSDVLRERICQAPTAEQAAKIGSRWYRRPKSNWSKIQVVVMTRAVYISAKSHPEVAAAILDTGEKLLVEDDSYDYFWGCGRDRRGENNYGQVIMKVRAKLLEEQQTASTGE
ncbi:NADAR family protein [Neiella marina]|uniref:NADAR family protein n=1 Tax=Neiella holothuriorum TaxID=2870530 RepID=A0ABS7EEW5_9GAMM|nr:NADAR family protein [Neiella holothuriorum]MBW8190870.1 NADAR family protein [Neiella holothuriorum]